MQEHYRVILQQTICDVGINKFCEDFELSKWFVQKLLDGKEPIWDELIARIKLIYDVNKH